MTSKPPEPKSPRPAGTSGEHQLKLEETVASLKTSPPPTAGLVLERQDIEDLIVAIRELGNASLSLFHENRVIKRALMVVAITNLLLIAAMAYAIRAQTFVLHQLDVATGDRAQVTKSLAEVTAKLVTADRKVAEVRSDVAEIPRFRVKAANSADPESKPTAVIEVPAVDVKSVGQIKGAPPSRPAASLEIPLDLSRPKK